MKANKMIGKFFKTISLSSEIILFPYDSESDIDVLLDTALISDGRYIVFFHREDKNIRQLSKFVNRDIIINDTDYIRLVPVTEKSPTYSILVTKDGEQQVLLNDDHSISEWVLHVIAKLKGVLIYEKNFNVSKQWRKVFP